jgi:hypothetical protein
LRLRHSRLARGSMLEVSRDAVAAGEEQLASCSAEQSKYCSISTETLDPCGIYLSRAGAVGSVFAAALTQVCTVVMQPAVAAQNIGVGPCRGGACYEMLEAMARIALSQPNGAIKRIASRSPMAPVVNKKNHSTRARFFGLDTTFFSKAKIDWQRGSG